MIVLWWKVQQVAIYPFWWVFGDRNAEIEKQNDDNKKKATEYNTEQNKVNHVDAFDDVENWIYAAGVTQKKKKQQRPKNQSKCKNKKKSTKTTPNCEKRINKVQILIHITFNANKEKRQRRQQDTLPMRCEMCVLVIGFQWKETKISIYSTQISLSVDFVVTIRLHFIQGRLFRWYYSFSSSSLFVRTLTSSTTRTHTNASKYSHVIFNRKVLNSS